MVDVEELPAITLAYKVSGQAMIKECRYCAKITEQLQNCHPWELVLTSIYAGYIAGVRHERKRQRKKATCNKILAPENITGQERELLAAFRAADDTDRAYIFKFAKWAQKEKSRQTAQSLAAKA